ncbi:MAG: hypothetical protein DVB30_01530 [Verrucomicrobia bacterium]|nr:MAG: hypothetical protein DVB30_01530 [Verrucomicrobiota bacterium]
MKYLPILVALFSSLCTSFAGDNPRNSFTPVQNALFRSNELQTDVYIAGSAGTVSGVTTTGVGGGLGINYFATKYLGFGVDNALEGLNGDGKTYDSLKGSVIVRLPIEKWHLAPYAMIGGGACWASGTSVGCGTVGPGIECRINRNVGLFLDSRYMFGNRPLNETQTRAGIRLVF